MGVIVLMLLGLVCALALQVADQLFGTQGLVLVLLVLALGWVAMYVGSKDRGRAARLPAADERDAAQRR